MTNYEILKEYEKHKISVPSYKEWKEMKEQRDACAWALDKIGNVLVKHKLVKKKDEVLNE